MKRLVQLVVAAGAAILVPQTATAVDGSDRCDAALLPQITIESASAAERAAFLSLVTDNNYEQARAGGGLSVIIEGLPIGASYNQFDESRRQYYQQQHAEYSRSEARALFRQTLSAAQLSAWTTCMTSEDPGIRIVLSEDDEDGASARIRYVDSPGHSKSFAVTVSGGHAIGGSAATKFTLNHGGEKGLLLVRQSKTSKLRVLVNGPDMTDTAVSLPPKPSPAKQAISMGAVDFVRGTNVAIDQCVAGPGTLANATPCSTAPNAAEFDFDAVAPGTYRLEINYAADGSRPVRVLVNGTVVREQALSSSTGGWANSHLSWTTVGPVTLRQGRNTIRLERSDVFPHIHDLRLLP